MTREEVTRRVCNVVQKMREQGAMPNDVVVYDWDADLYDEVAIGLPIVPDEKHPICQFTVRAQR